MTPTKNKGKTPWSVFLAIILAFLVGNLTGTDKGLWGMTYVSLFDTVGTLFLRSLTMIVAPLVFSSIVLGISKVGGEGSFKRLGCKIIGFYVLTTLSAILIGLFLVNLIEPGNAESLRALVKESSLSTGSLSGQTSVSFSSLILSIVPGNIFEALAKGEMLALIFFSLLFGYALSRVHNQAAKTVQEFFQGLFQTVLGITHLLMKVLPLGVFCLVAKVAATTGYKSLASLALFTFTVLGGLALFSFVILPLFLRFVAKVSPMAFFRTMWPALITAFSTSSSAASLPITMDCLEKRGGVSNRICGLVVPLGTSLNMSGSALYECVAVMFVAQVYGVDFSFSSQIVFVCMALLTAMGIAGIPSASLIAVMIILRAFNLPIEGIGLFLAMDRMLDMCRTTVNVLSDSCCAVLVAKSEGETHILQKENI
ncbi:MAG: dicarboxylate/amino acid:cation symporter [Chlamydiae bacterium]|nr:dicarboxylate/amino acid:cation symporter [Chlamydiota bacterium]